VQFVIIVIMESAANYWSVIFLWPWCSSHQLLLSACNLAALIAQMMASWALLVFLGLMMVSTVCTRLSMHFIGLLLIKHVGHSVQSTTNPRARETHAPAPAGVEGSRNPPAPASAHDGAYVQIERARVTRREGVLRAEATAWEIGLRILE
jgi:hypothetical protein